MTRIMPFVLLGTMWRAASAKSQNSELLMRVELPDPNAEKCGHVGDKCDGINGRPSCCREGATCTPVAVLGRSPRCRIDEQVTGCTCADGVPATAAECTGGHHCVRCNDGFVLSLGGFTCEAKACTCDNGKEVSGKDCPEHGASYCLHCDAGFHFDTVVAGLCVQNQCTCSNGVGSVGDKCVTDGDSGCDTCSTGYTKTPVLGVFDPKYTCEENQCTCLNGAGATGTNCAKHNTPDCASCIEGFTKKSDGTDGNQMCEMNQCTCSQGEGAKGKYCIADGEINCHKCNSGYHKVDVAGTGSGSPAMLWTTPSKCEENVCTCSNGDGATGPSCTEHSTAACAGCNDGYHVIPHTILGKQKASCELIECTCRNGRFATGKECIQHDKEDCHECDAGYYLEGVDVKKCKLMKCKCSKGTPSSGTECIWHDSEDCLSCEKGFYLQVADVKTRDNQRLIGDTCEACPDKFGNQCQSCTSENCTDCGDGQVADDSDGMCKAKQCTCENGLATSYTLCETDGTEQCKVCTAGFHLTPEQKCEAYVCTCDGGVVSSGCGSKSMELCESCHDGFYFLEFYSTCEHCTTEHGAFCKECTATECTHEAPSDELGAANSVKPKVQVRPAEYSDLDG